jgi:polyhydroxyalkanoate synthesis regulator phasin
MENTSPPSAPLFAAFMHDLAKQLVPLIVAELKHQTSAESLGLIALDPNNLSLPVYSLIQNDVAIRDQIKDMIDDAIDPHITSISRKVDELDSKFDDLEAKVDDLDLDDLQSSVSTLEERVGELEENGTPVDADNDNFQDAVRSVIRNHI